ncbi:cation diffusion facilitator CzcD-associated flavoprotein CzcO [Fluviicoccus keumensis]|uniref:Cation diffusion facilitator CzcD-associated flavoprotein CzcO n=1 Tax=Fluviicoccus keumensis TaxID=1435465 RepID=A0A4Q7YPD4_9GAMM|nr:NAD(P)/FAD-dependent oxidoreductase [Fluviicoccus keumensis]RZU38711.1 cation diffusion facilitator CzcD-associated flavoprotein CzcO [Fluviicoccus keumensis]
MTDAPKAAKPRRPKAAKTAVPAAGSVAPTPVREVEALIIGAGPSGLSACIKLKEQGVTDSVILDQANRIGGTWAVNDYPGLQCDVPSEMYSLGFAPNPEWTRTYAPQAEIQRYLERVAHDFGIVGQIRLNTRVEDARWDAAAARWRVTTAGGEVYRARFFIPAAGYIGEAKMPHFPGQDTFKGAVFHSGLWNHDYDLRGKRVAVIGCGASAIQFLPAIQPKVAHLYSFQRTPTWVLPKPDYAVPEPVRKLFKRVPLLEKLVRESALLGFEPLLPLFLRENLVKRFGNRLGEMNIRLGIPDPALRKALTPNHTFGCKRPLLSNDWYPALAQPNVTVLFQGLNHITENGVVGDDGVEIPVDAIIFGTGYAVAEPAIYRIIKGADGRSLSEHWQGSPRAYQGMAIHGFPNMFMMLGPNSHSLVGSVMWTSEHQAIYIAQAVKALQRGGHRVLEVRKPVQDQFNAGIEGRLAKMPIRADVCESYYLDKGGRNQFVWPEYGVNIKKRLTRFEAADYAWG